jgi:hypothetical protein
MIEHYNANDQSITTLMILTMVSSLSPAHMWLMRWPRSVLDIMYRMTLYMIKHYNPNDQSITTLRILTMVSSLSPAHMWLMRWPRSVLDIMYSDDANDQGPRS